MVSKAVSRKSCSFQSQLAAGQVAATLLGGGGGRFSRDGGFNGNGHLAISGGLDRVMRRGSDGEEKNGGGL